MKTELLSLEVQQFIEENLSSDIGTLALRKSPFSNIPMSILAGQIESKQKAKTKLALWYNTKNILFPSKLSIEQTSSDRCAMYKASLVKQGNLIDLTGGFGIDSYYFAQNLAHVTHLEMQEELSIIAQHNFKVLQQDNIVCHSTDSIAFLEQSQQTWDYIYLDPARRNQSKQKVFLLSDCTPDVIEHMDLLLQKTSTILIKTAPLLDIQAVINQLKYIKQVHIVALNNEVKELLWVVQKNYTGSIELIAVNINKDKTDLFCVNFDDHCIGKYGYLEQFLYEPNAAILKTGKFQCVSDKFDVKKLHQNSHLYTSEDLQEFSGRRFKIVNHYEYNKANAKQYLSNIKANITVRNFPLKVEDIRKKWKIKEGGNTYIFFTTLQNNEKVFIICEKINQ